MLVFKLKHYRRKTAYCGKCGIMISNKKALSKGKCGHCKEEL